MNLTSHARASQFALVAALLSPHLLLAERLTVNVAPDPKACAVVHLPKWKKPVMPAGDLPWGDPMECDYDFRSSTEGALVVSAYCRPGRFDKPVYSPNKYVVSFGSGRIRRATEDEWNHADPYLAFRVSSLKTNRRIENYEPLVYQGKQFPKGGLTWPLDRQSSSRLSQDGSFLAVNSWDGTVSRNGYDLPFFCGFLHRRTLLCRCI